MFDVYILTVECRERKRERRRTKNGYTDKIRCLCALIFGVRFGAGVGAGVGVGVDAESSASARDCDRVGFSLNKYFASFFLCVCVFVVNVSSGNYLLFN